MYMGFLMSEPKSSTCTRLSEVMGISHDSVNRFLLREAYEPKDLFNEASRLLNLVGGTLNVDDSTLDKPYSQHMELVGHFWSGKHHRVVKGLNLITLYYSDPQGRSLPVNYRVYDKAEGKTKNDYFLDMLEDVLAWGLQPAFMTGDSWYSCVGNLKTVRNHRMGFLFAVESNRRVSTEKGSWVQVQKLDIPADGLRVWLREFGGVKLFRTQLKDQLRHYVVFLPNADAYDTFQQADFQTLHDQHWQIEQYHRMIKQVCHIEKFQVRGKVPIRNHLFAALCSYIHLQQMRFADMISNAYQWQGGLYKEVVASFVKSFMLGKEHLNPQYQVAVNA
ncbi:transposase IS4 family protein [Thiothrix nivea DSM 5205]|uniref:Transposase IS4 family protein n=2 Tax=Thiothrix nivea TaxID=1031 RepID=A0A656HCJ7_THINJ|nr:transposase IS4 family protein [Thiothrix nivea DSM 5205]